MSNRALSYGLQVVSLVARMTEGYVTNKPVSISSYFREVAGFFSGGVPPVWMQETNEEWTSLLLFDSITDLVLVEKLITGTSHSITSTTTVLDLNIFNADTVPHTFAISMLTDPIVPPLYEMVKTLMFAFTLQPGDVYTLEGTYNNQGALRLV